jgi:hypothetical protein
MAVQRSRVSFIVAWLRLVVEGRGAAGVAAPRRLGVVEPYWPRPTWVAIACAALPAFIALPVAR